MKVNLRLVALIAMAFFLSSYQAAGDRQRFENEIASKQVLNFWKTHKAHVALELSGYLGAFGGTVGLNYHPQWTVELGFGGSGHFQSYGFRVKRLLLQSSSLNPYIAAGISRWHRTRRKTFQTGDVSPGVLGKKLMSDTDIRENRIDERLFHGALGLQYIAMGSSPLKDLGVFSELILLFDPQDVVLAPTFSVGVSYFF